MAAEQVTKDACPPVDQMKFKVFVVGGDNLVQNLFEKHGHSVVKNPEIAEMAVFTGGPDIFPLLYGQRPHRKTHVSMLRDMEEIKMYQKLPLKMPKVGICRGAQLLNVLSGGSMYQHVDGHASSIHDVLLWDGSYIKVTSTHHQMMRPHKNAWVMGESFIANSKEDDTGIYTKNSAAWDSSDAEILYYSNTNSYCFQGHPEYKACPDNAVNRFFEDLWTVFSDDIHKSRIAQRAT